MSDNTPIDSSPEPGRERGSSGLGILIAAGGTLMAGVAAVALFSSLTLSLPVVAGITGGLALLGGGLAVMQHHKEKVNDEHARRTFSQKKGYHHVEEATQDLSLMHLIKGKNDLPERVRYIEDHYGIKPVSANAFRARHLGMGLVIGAVVGGLFMAGIAAMTVGTFGMAGLAIAGITGTLAGATAFAAHSAHTMTRYDKYIDDLAAQGEAKLAQAPSPKERAPAPVIEYDNGCGRRRTFCEDVTASRQSPVDIHTCR